MRDPAGNMLHPNGMMTAPPLDSVTGWLGGVSWGGESGQWDPVITENQKIIGVPEGPAAEILDTITRPLQPLTGDTSLGFS